MKIEIPSVKKKLIYVYSISVYTPKNYLVEQIYETSIQKNELRVLKTRFLEYLKKNYSEHYPENFDYKSLKLDIVM